MSHKFRRKHALKWFHRAYGLGKKEFRQLGDQQIKVRVSFYPPSEEGLFPLKPRQRRRALKEWHQQVVKQITENFSFENPQFKVDHLVGFLEGTLPGKYLLELAVQPGVFITELPDFPFTKKRARKEDGWYAVRARFAIQVEGQTKGHQRYEDRIVLIQAKSFKQAGKRFKKQVRQRQYGAPYLNSEGRMVRWHLERITDIYETNIDKLDSYDTEVFSTLETRKMKRKYEWHPLAKKDRRARKK